MESKQRISLSNIYYYLQGNIRYRLYYSKFKFLIPSHILEQIEYRVNSMYRECYNKGQCVACGCQTTHLQMCNKSCDLNCYPPMLDKRSFKFLLIDKTIFIDNIFWSINTRVKKFIKNSNLK